MKAIVAVDKKWGIGNDGKLLARIPEDQKFFKDQTINKIVVMGRETLLSMPGSKPLKDRTNIVLTRRSNFQQADVIVCHGLDELFTKIDAYDRDDVFIIGGQSVYEQLLPCCTEVYVTKIDKEFEADRFFPNLDDDDRWERKCLKQDLIYDNIRFGFYKYVNKEL